MRGDSGFEALAVVKEAELLKIDPNSLGHANSRYFKKFLMDGTDSHPLKTFLQLHLGSDTSAVIYLPHIVATLTPEYLSPSPHLQKWITRVNSLLHSKAPGGRWAGLCLAYRTCLLSKDIMIQYAQSWLTVALPVLSVRPSVT
jgi:hypothetical protein